jgi:hypothetical protein
MRPRAPIPVAAELVPVPDARAPEGFTLVDQPIDGPLPLRIPLFGSVALVLVVPTGLGRQWRDRAPEDVVSSGAGERVPLDPTAPPPEPPARPPVRLYLVRGADTMAAVPLAAGLRTTLAAGPDALVELVVIGWEIRAGTVRLGGDVGSRITVAWRDASAAPPVFSPDPIDRRVAARRRALGGRR